MIGRSLDIIVFERVLTAILVNDLLLGHLGEKRDQRAE